MDNICLECGASFKKETGLNIHISSKHNSLETYYHKHFARYDKYDGDLIKFHDKKTYLSSCFNTRANKKAWLKYAPTQDVKQYVSEFWRERVRTKKLTSFPSQIEMRSLDMPGRKYLDEILGGHHNFFIGLGLKPRFAQDSFLLPKRDISKQKIIIDTREQKPLGFNHDVVYQALKFGDYRLSNDSVSKDCYVERKSIADLYGTLSKGFERFEKEIKRAEDADSYLVIIIEGSLEDLHIFTHSPFLNLSLKGRVSSPQLILHNMRALILKYSHIQFLFVKSRGDASKCIKRIFQSNGEYKDIDLQYVYDVGEII